MISDNKFIELLNSKPELGFKIMMESYMPFIYKLVSNELLIIYSKEEIEQYLSDVFWEVFSYKNKIDSQSSFIEVFLSTIAKRKVIEVHRRNNNQVNTDYVSLDLHTISEDIVRSILLKESNSPLIDAANSLNEPDSKIITRKYYLNQNIKDISGNSGFKVSAYA